MKKYLFLAGVIVFFSPISAEPERMDPALAVLDEMQRISFHLDQSNNSKTIRFFNKNNRLYIAERKMCIHGTDFHGYYRVQTTEDINQLARNAQRLGDTWSLDLYYYDQTVE